MKTAAEELVCLDASCRKPIAGGKLIFRHRCNPQKTSQLNKGGLPKIRLGSLLAIVERISINRIDVDIGTPKDLMRANKCCSKNEHHIF
jgi:hypothetical protein